MSSERDKLISAINGLTDPIFEGVPRLNKNKASRYYRRSGALLGGEDWRE